jgi:hypothetical protein
LKLHMLVASTSLLMTAAIAVPVTAQGQVMDRATLVRGYAQFCATQGTQMPGAAGESDIKGDARLAAYCACFGGKFADRAVASLGKPRTAPFDMKKSVAEEYAMRNTCRAQMGLPKAVQTR